MIEKYGFFDSLEGDEREYSEADFARWGRVLAIDGVRGGADALKVNPYATGLAVSVNPGYAMVQGRYYALEDDGTGAKILSLSGALSNPRIDRIVLRLYYATRTIEVGVLQGAESAQPTAPTLQRDSDVYMLSLAQVRVGVAASGIAAGDVTDERHDESVCGIMIVSPDAAMRAAQGAQKTADEAKNAAQGAQKTADDANTRLDNLKIGVTGGKNGNLVSLDENGNITDSGRALSSLGTGATYSLNGTVLEITTLP